MFTELDIIHVAIQIERNGEATYRSAAVRAKEPEVAELLTWMAEEEERHACWFEELILEQRAHSPEEEEMEAMGRRLLQDMVKSQTFSLEEERLVAAGDLAEVFRQCRAFEEDTILFYEFLQGIVDDPAAMEQLARIIEEERGHLRQLEQLLVSCG
ncbi:ferritin-like domain-containing protein [Desulfogranum mediterraneum]|uniref:ferritin-like domain-containing protein n=1 Tax=Desulfogranum mediterraneum TaxID=160661 RepID=UPI00040A90F8|nr:ferritin family protein [Desulfogranum mediterraneum]